MRGAEREEKEERGGEGRGNILQCFCRCHIQSFLQPSVGSLGIHSLEICHASPTNTYTKNTKKYLSVIIPLLSLPPSLFSSLHIHSTSARMEELLEDLEQEGFRVLVEAVVGPVVDHPEVHALKLQLTFIYTSGVVQFIRVYPHNLCTISISPLSSSSSYSSLVYLGELDPRRWEGRE